jgi:hypothetical protein
MSTAPIYEDTVFLFFDILNMLSIYYYYYHHHHHNHNHHRHHHRHHHLVVVVVLITCVLFPATSPLEPMVNPTTQA